MLDRIEYQYRTSRDSQTSRAEATQKPSRKSRAKENHAWSGHVLATGGLCDEHLRQIAHVYPHLSPCELRVAALVRGMLSSTEIGDVLGINERTVENHRMMIRRKIGLRREENLLTHLTGL